jgi:general secretion pathway protein F
MTQFAFSAIPSDGGAGTVTGTREAPDESALREALRAEGLIAVEVRPVHVLDALRSAFGTGRVRRGDVAWFYQTLRLLLENRVPIESAVRTMQELAPHPRLARLCGEIRESLRAGETLADAVAARPSLASDHHVALLRSGQQSGRLDHAVALVDGSISSSMEIRRALVGQLLYPALLVLAAIVALWFLSVRVIPRFAETIATLGGELPWQTSATLATASVLAWAVPLLVVALAAAWATRSAWSSPELRVRVHTAALRVPLVGTLLWNAQGALVADMLATMLSGGADLLAGLAQARDVASSPVIAERLDGARRDVREGADPGRALADRRVLPPMATAVVRSGIAGGDLVGSLRRASQLCLETQKTLASRLLTFVEPAIILVLAGAIGWVVYSLVVGMLAITNLGGS